MKAKEIRQLSKENMDKKIEEIKKELIKLNAQISMGTNIKNPGQIRTMKKTIARILTIKAQKHE